MWRAVNDRALAAAGWLVALIGFSLPISTALDNALLGLLLIAFLLSGRFREKLRTIAGNPVAFALIGFFAWIAIGTLYGEAPVDDRLNYLGKYSDLLLVVMMVPFFADERTRNRALLAFAAAMALTLVLSLLLAGGLLPAAKWVRGHPGNAVVFKLQITHNLLMAFAAFAFASAAVRETALRKRRLLYAFALAAFVDVLFFVVGRTGQVALGVLTVYFFSRHFGWRGFLAGCLATAVAVIAAWHLSVAFSERVVLATAEYRHAQEEQLADKSSSVGQRIEWYRNTARLMTERPLIGFGTGGFPKAYAGFVTDPTASKPAHPHNQYLMTGTENGLIGLAAFIALLVWLWRSAARLADPLRRELGRGLLIAFSIGCVFNSLLLDHVEGLFFAWMLSLVFGGVCRSDSRGLHAAA